MVNTPTMHGNLSKSNWNLDRFFNINFYIYKNSRTRLQTRSAITSLNICIAIALEAELIHQ